MSKRKPFDPKELKVGDTVEWVEAPDVWDVEVLDIRDYGIIVDAGYGKTALFAPSSEGDGRYIRLVGAMEMDDYLRNPKEKVTKKAKNSAEVVEERQPIEPEKFEVGEMIEWVQSDGTIWDERILAIDVNSDAVLVSCSWDKKVFRLRDGKYVFSEPAAGIGWVDSYIRHPKKKVKKDKKK